jgi:hypothetical protein
MSAQRAGVEAKSSCGHSSKGAGGIMRGEIHLARELKGCRNLHGEDKESSPVTISNGSGLSG